MPDEFIYDGENVSADVYQGQVYVSFDQAPGGENIYYLIFLKAAGFHPSLNDPKLWRRNNNPKARADAVIIAKAYDKEDPISPEGMIQILGQYYTTII